MSAKFLSEGFFPCHFVTMAHKVHIGQQFDDFSAFESAISNKTMEMCNSSRETLVPWKLLKGFLTRLSISVLSIMK